MVGPMTGIGSEAKTRADLASDTIYDLIDNNKIDGSDKLKQSAFLRDA